MHGFISVISLQKKSVNLKVKWKPLFDFQQSHSIRSMQTENMLIEQYCADKFLSEKFFLETEDYIFVNEGIILNIDHLMHKNNCNDKSELIFRMIENDEIFFSKFEGNFCGFMFIKKNGAIYAFNNQAGTRKLYYFYNEEYLIFSTDLYTLGQTLDQLKISKTPDIEAASLLLTSGFMHEDLTLIKKVRQIRAGEFVKVHHGNFKKEFYFDLSTIQETGDDEDTILENLDKLFREAIDLEYSYGQKFKQTPVTTLSGGLDSRMVALMSHDLGYHQQVFFNFSEKEYADEVIAREIAETYNTKLIQTSLTPDCLVNIDDIVAVNDGLTIYSGSGHVFEAIKTFRGTDTAIIHTGILGDGYMGSYVYHKRQEKAGITDGVYSTKYIEKAREVITKSISNYKNEELYKFYNRAFMGINNGFLYFNLLGESFSAFTYSPFAAYAFSVPTHLKYKKKTYINWIKKLHPEYAGFVWESIGGKPTNNKILRFTYRVRRAVVKRLPWKTMWKNNMNPEQLWYDTNPQVKSSLDNYFDSNIHRADFNQDLKSDLIRLYNTGNINEKTQVLTLLAAYKLHFNKSE